MEDNDNILKFEWNNCLIPFNGSFSNDIIISNLKHLILDGNTIKYDIICLSNVIDNHLIREISSYFENWGFKCYIYYEKHQTIIIRNSLKSSIFHMSHFPNIEFYYITIFNLKVEFFCICISTSDNIAKLIKQKKKSSINYVCFLTTSNFISNEKKNFIKRNFFLPASHESKPTINAITLKGGECVESCGFADCCFFFFPAKGRYWRNNIFKNSGEYTPNNYYPFIHNFISVTF